MKKLLAQIVFVLSVCSAYAQTNSLQYYINQAREAQKTGDTRKFYEMILEAHKLHPYHQGILYQTGVAAALNGKTDESISFLKRAILIKADYDLTVPELKSLENDAEFEKLKSLQTELQKQVVHSDTAFIIKDRSLHIESIASGESSDVFYLGSVHKRKIVRVKAQFQDRSSKDHIGVTSLDVKDFTSAGQDGLCAVLSVKVDTKRKILWACSTPMEEMENFDTTARAAVYKYDLTSGKLLAKYYPSGLKGHIFGDLTLDPTGNVFVSDSKNNTIFVLNEKTKALEKFIYAPEFRNLQGLAFNDKGTDLYVADYGIGIYHIDVKSKEVKYIPPQGDVSTKAIDGLTFYKNSLIAIQNLVYPMRVTQYFLNDKKDALKSYEIIDRGHPAFNEPTIGCRVGDTFFYVANSQWSGYDQQHNMKPSDQLQDVVILKADLK
jgi:hypothetical protein